MSKSKVLVRLNEMGLRPETISFYCDKDGNERPDTTFALCEISGEIGMVVDCIALGINGEVYSFRALDSLVGGVLGKLAGAL
jgi:hypothetical protein